MFPLMVIYTYKLVISVSRVILLQETILRLESLSMWLEARNCLPEPEPPRMCPLLNQVLKVRIRILHANMSPEWLFCPGLGHTLPASYPWRMFSQLLHEAISKGNQQSRSMPAKTYPRGHSCSPGLFSASPPQGGSGMHESSFPCFMSAPLRAGINL